MFSIVSILSDSIAFCTCPRTGDKGGAKIPKGPVCSSLSIKSHAWLRNGKALPGSGCVWGDRSCPVRWGLHCDAESRRQPLTIWKNVCIAACVHPLPLSSISHGGALSVWLRGGIWIRLSPVSRINHFSFRLIVYPQSTELDQKLWNLFSKKIFWVGENVPAGGGRIGELGEIVKRLKYGKWLWGVEVGSDCRPPGGRPGR